MIYILLCLSQAAAIANPFAARATAGQVATKPFGSGASVGLMSSFDLSS
jgi:hypothetical protein